MGVFVFVFKCICVFVYFCKSLAMLWPICALWVAGQCIGVFLFVFQCICVFVFRFIYLCIWIYVIVLLQCGPVPLYGLLASTAHFNTGLEQKFAKKNSQPCFKLCAAGASVQLIEPQCTKLFNCKGGDADCDGDDDDDGNGDSAP